MFNKNFYVFGFIICISIDIFLFIIGDFKVRFIFFLRFFFRDFF